MNKGFTEKVNLGLLSPLYSLLPGNDGLTCLLKQGSGQSELIQVLNFRARESNLRSYQWRIDSLALISYGHYQNNISHSLNKSLKFVRRIQNIRIFRGFQNECLSWLPYWTMAENFHKSDFIFLSLT